MQRRGPAAWRTTAAAYADTRSYISELLERERQRLLGSSSLGTKKNLLGALVATSDGAAKHEQLSQTELVGNVFVFAVAGLETTAGTMQYALTQLALHRDLQEWMWTDLDVALKGMSEDPTEWDYSVVWPKLIAPLCIIVPPPPPESPLLSITQLTRHSTKRSAYSRPSNRSQNGPPARRKPSPTNHHPSLSPPRPPYS